MSTETDTLRVTATATSRAALMNALDRQAADYFGITPHQRTGVAADAVTVDHGVRIEFFHYEATATYERISR